MTPTEFQIAYSGRLKEVLDEPVGKALLMVLQALRPAMQASFPTEHAMIRAYANNEGYTNCLQNIVGLALPPKQTSQVEANYGVPDKPTTKE